MWLKYLITQYSMRLVAASRPLSRVSASKRGVISEKVRMHFKEKVVLPMVRKLCQDLDMHLLVKPDRTDGLAFQIRFTNLKLLGTVLMPNPLNGRAFFQYAIGRRVEIYSYRLFLDDLRRMIACQQKLGLAGDLQAAQL